MTSINEDDFLEYALQHGFGELHLKVDKASGMKAIIAIHSTKLGPALGGCRFIAYPDTSTAIYDAMRLARGMSYKSALANLPLGGGKSVIILPSTPYDRTAYLNQFGEFVNDLNGRYITALDSGTQLCDMDIIATHTPYVASLSSHQGDPSPATAKGVFRGIQAAVAFKLGKESLEGLHIAIQGLGHVGYLLAQHLHHAGARLTVADISPERVALVVDECHATAVSTDVVHKIPCDVFAPCALGAIINDQTIEEFLHEYHGEGIQHVALATNDIYAAVHQLRKQGVQFLDVPDTYYDMIGQRIPWHKESLAQLQEGRILIDGELDPANGLLLQIFTENAFGPVFFELIQRRGNQGFGEGNFQALFEAIERDQIKRGTL